MSQQLKNSLHNIADRVTATEASQQAWFDFATAQQPPARFPRRTAVLAAALVAILALAGFAFANSIYFSKIFGESLSLSIPELSDSQLKELLTDLSAGDVLNSEMETDAGMLSIRAIRGDTLDFVTYGFQNKEEASINTFPHPSINSNGFMEKAPSIKGMEVDQTNSLEDHIASGEFVAALDGGEYTLEHILLDNGKIDTLLYQAKNGSMIQICAISGKVHMDEADQKRASVSDIVIGDKVFTMIQHPGKPEPIDISLYLDQDRTVCSISLNNFNPITGRYSATKEQMLDAAKYLVLYNEHTTTTLSDVATQAFFETIHDPVIQASAGEIAAAILGTKRDDGSTLVTAWEKDGRSVSVYSHYNKAIAIDFGKMSYVEATKSTAVPEHSPFDQEDWFPISKLSSTTLSFDDGQLSLASWSSEDSSCSMRMYSPWDQSSSQTPLDQLAKCIHSAKATLLKVVTSKNGSPYLIQSVEQNGKLDILITGIQTWNEKTLVYELRIEEAKLPGGSVETWIQSI